MTVLQSPPGAPPPSAPPAPPAPAERIRPRSWGRIDLIEVLATGLSALCLTWLVYEQLTPFFGGLGFVVFWYAAFLLMYWLVVWYRRGPTAARDRLAASVISGAGVIVVGALVVIIAYTAFRGLRAWHIRFLTTDMRYTGPLSPPTAGGAFAAIVGSVEQVGLAMVISVPLGVATAVFLSEIGGRMGVFVRLLTDAMNGIPSVVAALFILAALQLSGILPFCGFSVSLALSVALLPTITRTGEVMLRLVPGGLREASLALGGTEWRMVRRVLLPTARAGLITAVILGLARVVGETAPTLINAGASNEVNWNPFSGPQDSLPYYVYRLIRRPILNDQLRAWTGALVLVAIVLLLFVTARILANKQVGKPSLLRRLLRRKGTSWQQ